jgi:hypothetical protein
MTKNKLNQNYTLRGLIVLFFTLLTIQSTNAQVFLGRDVQYYKGTRVAAKELSDWAQPKGYSNFFLNIDTNTNRPVSDPGRRNNDTKPFQFQRDSYSSRSSDYNRLVGMEFDVLDVLKQTTRDGYYTLVLKNEEIGTIYYSYWVGGGDSDFELKVVSGLQLPDGYWCKTFKITEDKFDGSVTFRSEPQWLRGITFTRIISKDPLTDGIYFHTVHGSRTLLTDIRGLYIIFDDGTKIERPNEKIYIKADRYGWDYSTMFRIEKADLQKISTSMITDFRTYIFDTKVSKEESYRVMEYAKCLSSGIEKYFD